MLVRALTYILLILLLIQSSVAMGDAHQWHQSGTEHFTFDDTHDHNSNKLSDFVDANTDDTSSQIRDCHHCCHCHGHLCPAILLAIPDVHLNKCVLIPPDYTENTIPQIFDSFLRPPIA